MNRIPALKLPNLTAEVLQEGVILEPKKGKVLSEEDCRALALWLLQVSPVAVLWPDGHLAEMMAGIDVNIDCVTNRYMYPANDPERYTQSGKIKMGLLPAEPSHGFPLHD